MIDLRDLTWSKNPRQTQGTGGTYLKAERVENGVKIYYKMSNYNSEIGVYGHESILEVLVCRYFAELDIPCAEYELINATVTVDGKVFNAYISKSPDFKKPGESKVALEAYYLLNKTGNESILDFCRRAGFGDYIDTTFLADFLIINRDRHDANIEVLRNNGSIRLAPLFDNGLCLTAPCVNAELLKSFDFTQNHKTNNALGSPFLFDNLNYISKPVSVKKITKDTIDGIFTDIENILPSNHVGILKQALIWRYDYAKHKKFLCER